MNTLLRLLKRHEDKIKTIVFALVLGYVFIVADELIRFLGAGQTIALALAVWVLFLVGRS